MKGGLARVLRWIVYFRRGHNFWFVYLLSFANFVVIQYRLLVEYVPFLKFFFTSLWVFAATFILIYVPLAIVAGWIDTKKATRPKEQEVNPYFHYPTGKEKEIYAPYFIATLKVLSKLCEQLGLHEEREEIAELISLIEKWRRKKP